MCNVEMSILNKRNGSSKIVKSKELKGCILKGFDLDDMQKRSSMKRLMKAIEAKVKLNPNEEFKIIGIELLIQLGFGVDE